MYICMSNSYLLLLTPQKAAQDNHASKRRRRTMIDLLKKDDDTEPKDALASLASQAAAEAAARSKNIRKGVEQLDDERDEDDTTRPLSRGEVVQDLEAEAHDIREKGIHHLNLQERLPWLKKSPTKEDSKEQEDDQPEQVLSPDSGLDQLSPEEGYPLHDHTFEEDLSIASSVHSLLMNGYPEETHEVYLPPKDYHIDNASPEGYLDEEEVIPPRDYPKKAVTGSQTQLLEEDDYYSMMSNGALTA